MKLKLVLVSPSFSKGGNFSTVSRIKNHLESSGYECELKEPRSLYEASYPPDHSNDQYLLIGIHAFRTGPSMRKSGLPYILILGGTDINVFSQQAAALESMKQAVNHAKYVICFNDAMKFQALQLWPFLMEKRIKIIRQAVYTKPSRLNLCEFLKSYGVDSQKEAIVFSLIAGIRPVKNPLFLVQLFKDWHKCNKRIYLLIVGPPLDSMYTTTVFEPQVKRCPGIVYVPGVSNEDAHAIIQQSFALVNSSDSEGMCLAILEAMKLGVVVLARDVPGNRSVIQDGVNGLLFDSPRTFQEVAENLLNDPEGADHIRESAHAYVNEHHSMERESSQYLSLVQAYTNQHSHFPSFMHEDLYS